MSETRLNNIVSANVRHYAAKENSPETYTISIEEENGNRVIAPIPVDCIDIGSIVEAEVERVLSDMSQTFMAFEAAANDAKRSLAEAVGEAKKSVKKALRIRQSRGVNHTLDASVGVDVDGTVLPEENLLA